VSMHCGDRPNRPWYGSRKPDRDLRCPQKTWRGEASRHGGERQYAECLRPRLSDPKIQHLVSYSTARFLYRRGLCAHCRERHARRVREDLAPAGSVLLRASPTRRRERLSSTFPPFAFRPIIVAHPKTAPAPVPRKAPRSGGLADRARTGISG